VRVDGGECGATSVEAQKVVVIDEVVVEEEVTTIKPVSIFIMLDQSFSMVPLWPGAITGINAFVNSPMSDGVKVALGFFPVLFGTPGGLCDGTGYRTPAVPLTTLTDPANTIPNFLGGLPLPTGIGTPIEGALRGVTGFCQDQQTARPDEKCVAVLVTDGAPSECNGDHNALVQIATQARSNGVTTYAVGLFGSDFALLDRIAMEGGAADCDPNQPVYACDVTAGADRLVNALNSIRDAVVTVETHIETTMRTVETPLECEWEIPAPPQGEQFDRNEVNVKLTAPGLDRDLGRVDAESACAEGGWHYDDADAPTRILACPETCATITATMGARIDILLGCLSIPLE
jgi:hypothetical protein